MDWKNRHSGNKLIQIKDIPLLHLQEFSYVRDSQTQDIFSGCYVAILNGLIASTNDDQALKVIANKAD